MGGDAKINGVTVGRGGGSDVTNTVVGNTAPTLSNGGNNTAIGTSAGSNTTTGNNNIFTGNNAQGTSATASNQLNIWNWIYGGGNIGIGVTNPIAKLAVNGGIKFANDSDACVATKSGTMRYTGTALQFCDGTTWQNINLGTAGLIPSGAIQAFYLSSCPSGWSPANGSNGTPDLRGEFVRGLDGGRGVDAGRTLGSWQNHTIQDHKHYIVWQWDQITPFVAFNDYNWDNRYLMGDVWDNYNTIGVPRGDEYFNVGGMRTGNAGTETRPRNIALLYCMKL